MSGIGPGIGLRIGPVVERSIIPSIGPDQLPNPLGQPGSWDVYAVHGGRSKLLGRRVGVFRVTKLVKAIEAKGFEAVVSRSGPSSAYLKRVDPDHPDA